MVHAAVAEARAGRGARPDDAASRGRSRSSASCSRRRRRGAASRRCSSTPPCATSRSCASSACRSGRAGCACAAPRRRRRGRSASRSRSAARRSARATSSCSTPTAPSSSSRSGSTRCSPPPRARRARAREAGEAPGGRALLRPRRPAGARRGVTEPIHDVARIGHAELLTPKPDESLRFFVDVLGMEEEAREGQSVYLRGWGDYLRYSLKLTESPQAGLGHVALRAWSPEALERRVAAIEATGLGPRLDRRRRRPRAGLPLHRPRRPRVRALLRGRALRRRPST